MASSVRARQSNTASRPNRGPTALPQYQTPANKLNDAAQRALHNLPSSHRLDGLHKRLKQANVVLSNTAGELNDRYHQKVVLHRRRQARRRAQGLEDDEEDDPAVEKLGGEVEDMTSRIEQSVRMIIDSKAAVEEVEKSLKELDANITAGRGAVIPTQSSLGASQFRQKRRKRAAESDEEENEESSGEAPTTQVVGDGPALSFKNKVAEHNSTYQDLSMQERYASNNDYIGFRKIIHDALHPGDDAPPMPKASTWFPDSQVTLGAADGNASQPAPVANDDDEVAIASEKKSLKCPITLLTMTDPLSSTKCPHSFERSAILGMLELSERRPPANGPRGAQGGERTMKCPECSVELTAADLQSDPVLIRRIRRLQAAEAMEEGGSDDDEEEPPLPRGTQKCQAEPISSDNEDNHSAAARARSAIPRIKAEKLASSARVRDVSVVPNSQVQGLIRDDERPPSTAESEIADLEDTYTEDGEE